MGTAIKKNCAKATGYEPQVIHISAQEGQPSTFWKSASGKYYRTKDEAIKDSGMAVNPDNYKVQVSFLAKYKNYILGALVAAIVTAALFYFVPKIAAKLKK